MLGCELFFPCRNFSADENLHSKWRFRRIFQIVYNIMYIGRVSFESSSERRGAVHRRLRHCVWPGVSWRRLFLKWPLHDIASTPVTANANTTVSSVSFNYSNGALIIVIMEEPVRTSSLSIDLSLDGYRRVNHAGITIPLHIIAFVPLARCHAFVLAPRLSALDRNPHSLLSRLFRSIPFRIRGRPFLSLSLSLSLSFW